jgi:hypothetical protein
VRKQFANQQRVAANNRTNIDQQKETTIMTEAETETVESMGKQPPELAIEEREDLLHIKIHGSRGRGNRADVVTIGDEVI